jgi:hypothetical protein
MMTPEEKAKYLISINSLAILSEIGNKITMDQIKEIAIQCTIISVDEIINALDFNKWQNAKQIDYWEEVKQEIQ